MTHAFRARRHQLLNPVLRGIVWRRLRCDFGLDGSLDVGSLFGRLLLRMFLFCLDVSCYRCVAAAEFEVSARRV